MIDTLTTARVWQTFADAFLWQNCIGTNIARIFLAVQMTINESRGDPPLLGEMMTQSIDNGESAYNLFPLLLIVGLEPTVELNGTKDIGSQ